ncbi:MAG TPA: hypothetical protein VK577_14435 [Bradyrhizobium sp.]|nr:hypothetical protein [Bradyrhizobium sp.]
MANSGVDSSAQNQGVKIGSPLIYNTPTPAIFATGNQTYAAADIVGAILLHSASGGASNGQLPTAAAIAAILRGAGTPLNIGDTIDCIIINNGGNVLTLVLGAGISFDTGGNGTIPANNSKDCQFRFTGVTPGAETCVIYS